MWLTEWEGGLEENGCIYMHGWVLLLFTWNITAFLFFLKVYLFWLHCCEPAFSSCNEWGLLFVVVLRLLTTVTPLISAHRLWSAGSVIVAHELSCSEACGIFPEQEWNPVPGLAGRLLTTIKEPLYIVHYIVRLLQNCKLVAQFRLVVQSCLTLCDTINPNMPGLPVRHQLPESTQTHVHWVGDAI